MNFIIQTRPIELNVNVEEKQIEIKFEEKKENVNIKFTDYDDKEIKEELKNLSNDKADKKDIPTKLSQLQNDKGYLSEIPSEYKTKSENDQLYQSKGDYALKSEIPDVSGFITKTVDDLVNYYKKNETYTKQEVNSLIGQISTISILVVDQLPITGESNVIYLVPSENPKVKNEKDEFIWVGKWEQIGSTAIDLSNYYTKEEVNQLLANIDLSDYYTKSQIDSLLRNLNIPTKLSELEEDTTHRVVTDTEKETWNNKSNFSGEYTDLSNNPVTLRNDTGEITLYSLVPESGTICYQFLNSVILKAETSAGTWRVTLAPGNKVSADSDGQFSFFCPAGNVYMYPVETPITSETLWAGGYCPTIEDVELMTAEAGYWDINQNATATGTVNMIKGQMFKKTRATGVTRLTIKFPDEIDENYKSRLVLHTATSFSTFTISADYDTYFYGDDCADGVLTGVGSKYYDINARADGFGGVLVEVVAKENA